MSTAFGFRERRDVLTLKQMAREYRSTPQRNLGYTPAFDIWRSIGNHVGQPARKFPSLRAYLMVPEAAIPAAYLVGGKLYLGYGNACLWHRKKDTEEGDKNAMFPDYPVNDNQAIWEEDPDNPGQPVKLRVFNFCPEPIVPKKSCKTLECGDVVIYVVQDLWGDLYVVKDCEFPTCSSSSSSSSSYSSSSSRSSSSGSSSGKSSSSQQSSSSESESSKPSSQSSQSGSECSFTGTVIVGKGDLTRVGEYVQESKQKLTYRDGALCKVEDAGVSSAYVCCDSSNGSTSTSEPPPPPPPPGCELIFSFKESTSIIKGDTIKIMERTVTVNLANCTVTRGPWKPQKYKGKKVRACLCPGSSSSSSSQPSSKSSKSSSSKSSKSSSSVASSSTTSTQSPSISSSSKSSSSSTKSSSSRSSSSSQSSGKSSSSSGSSSSKSSSSKSSSSKSSSSKSSSGSSAKSSSQSSGKSSSGSSSSKSSSSSSGTSGSGGSGSGGVSSGGSGEPCNTPPRVTGLNVQANPQPGSGGTLYDNVITCNALPPTPLGGPVTYNFYRNGVMIASTLNNFYTDSGLPCGNTYTYWIIPINNCGQSQESPDQIQVHPPCGSGGSFGSSSGSGSN